MNSGRTISVEKGARRSPAETVTRGARQTLGGAVTVVGSVGCVAGKLVDGAGTILGTTAGAISGTVLLLGDVLKTTGHVLGSTVTGLGNTLAMTGALVSGNSFVDAAARAQTQSLPGPIATANVVPSGTTAAPAPTRPRTASAKKARPAGPTAPSTSPS